MPLLNSNVQSNHFGYFVGFDSLNSNQVNSIEELTQEAINHGMDVKRIFATWKELNPEEDVYNIEGLENELQNNFNLGIKTFVSVTTLDSGGIDDVPDRFHSDSSPSGLNSKWTSDAMLNSYLNVLDRVIPLCDQYNGYAIALANEPQFYFEDVDGDEEDFIEFIRLSRDHIHQLSNDVPVTIALANYNLDISPSKDLLDLSDIVTLNLYGYVGTANDWVNDIIFVEELVSPKQIVFQEMGFSTASDGASEEMQVDYINAVTDHLIQSNQLRVFYWFLFHDPLDGFLDAIASELINFVPQEFIDDYLNELSGLGLCTLSSTTCNTKLGYNAFISSLDNIYNINTFSSILSPIIDTISFPSVSYSSITTLFSSFSTIFPSFSTISNTDTSNLTTFTVSFSSSSSNPSSSNGNQQSILLSMILLFLLFN